VHLFTEKRDTKWMNSTGSHKGDSMRTLSGSLGRISIRFSVPGGGRCVIPSRLF